MSQLIIGIDIGGTNLRMALISPEGVVYCRCRMPSLIAEGRDAFCGRMLRGISDLRAEAQSLSSEVVAIGIGVPGLVGNSGLIHSSVNMRPLDGFNLSSFLSEQTGIQTECANDANLIALGEQLYGAGRGKSSFVVITIGTGLGSGLVLDGKLWNGAGGFASEFGHVTVDPDGELCSCGNRGCLERYVSAEALVRTMAELSPDLGKRSLCAEEIALMARNGNLAALEAFRRMGRWLGIALASLSNTLNLEAVIVGGGVAASLDLFEPVLRIELANRCFLEIHSAIDIIKGELGDDAGLLGATALANKHIANSQKL
ncbi:MAG: ROK family protein [Deltaproteobacteria bacterium]|nr:ROK family protein [Deltaproteobacteria bacterium]